MSPLAELGDDNYPISKIWDTNCRMFIIGNVALPRPFDSKAPAIGGCAIIPYQRYGILTAACLLSAMWLCHGHSIKKRPP